MDYWRTAPCYLTPMQSATQVVKFIIRTTVTCKTPVHCSHCTSIYGWLTYCLDIQHPVNRDGHIKAKHKSSDHKYKSNTSNINHEITNWRPNPVTISLLTNWSLIFNGQSTVKVIFVIKANIISNTPVHCSHWTSVYGWLTDWYLTPSQPRRSYRGKTLIIWSQVQVRYKPQKSWNQKLKSTSSHIKVSWLTDPWYSTPNQPRKSYQGETLIIKSPVKVKYE